jgi:hypothetical protein
VTSIPSRLRAAGPVGVLVAGLVLSGCAQETRVESDDGQVGGALPSRHVHGVGIDPGDGRAYLATHDGLFRYGSSGPARVGPLIDLMGFTIAGPGHFYASGHPGAGTDLPDPVGLIESTDAGRTWTPLSRQGKSDFHTLTATRTGVIGFDGRWWRSTDADQWQEIQVPVDPFSIAASPDGQTILATSRSGPFRSVDSGRTWVPADPGGLLLVVDWAGGDTVVGLTPDGSVQVSSDAGATWRLAGTVRAAPQAVAATLNADRTVRILVATDRRMLESTDGGATFIKQVGLRVHQTASQPPS